MSGWGFGGGFMMLFFWALVILLIVWFAKSARSENHSDANREKSPMEILKERYAKGEIDQKEFEEKKKDLTG